MSVDSKLAHAAREARRSVADVAPATDARLTGAVRIRRTLAATAAASLGVALLVVGALLAASIAGEPEIANQPSILPESLEPWDLGPATGAGWTAIPGPPIATRIDGVLGRLADGTWVALDRGWRSSPPQSDPTEILWSSTDGADFTSTPITAFEGLVVHHSRPSAYVHVYAGLLWAWTSPPGGAVPTETWTSADGLDWHRVEWVGVESGNVPGLDTDAEPGERRWRFARIRDIIVLTHQSASGTEVGLQVFVSMDGGRAFVSNESFPQTHQFAIPWTVGDEFRILTSDASSGPTLWRSTNGLSWETVGAVTGMDWPPERSDWWKSTAVSSSPETTLLAGWDCDGTIYRSNDGGMVWERLDIAPAIPLDIDPGFDFRQVGCRRAIADGGWILVEGNYRVWTSRNGVDWYHLSDDSFIDFSLHPYAHPLSSFGGIAVPPHP